MTDPGDQPSSSQPDGLLSPRKRIALRVVSSVCTVLLVPMLILLPLWLMAGHSTPLRVVSAMTTVVNIRVIVRANHGYRDRYGEFPEGQEQLVLAGFLRKGIARDVWGNPYKWQYTPDELRTQVRDERSRPIEIVSAPDEDGIYIYSIGENGVDELGAGDDISSWDYDDNYRWHRSYSRRPNFKEGFLSVLPLSILLPLLVVYILSRWRLNKDLKARDRFNDPWHRASDRVENGNNCRRKGEYS